MKHSLFIGMLAIMTLNIQAGYEDTAMQEQPIEEDMDMTIMERSSNGQPMAMIQEDTMEPIVQKKQKRKKKQRRYEESAMTSRPKRTRGASVDSKKQQLIEQQAETQQKLNSIEDRLNKIDNKIEELKKARPRKKKPLKDLKEKRRQIQQEAEELRAAIESITNSLNQLLERLPKKEKEIMHEMPSSSAGGELERFRKHEEEVDKQEIILAGVFSEEKNTEYHKRKLRGKTAHELQEVIKESQNTKDNLEKEMAQIRKEIEARIHAKQPHNELQVQLDQSHALEADAGARSRAAQELWDEMNEQPAGAGITPAVGGKDVPGQEPVQLPEMAVEDFGPYIQEGATIQEDMASGIPEDMTMPATMPAMSVEKEVTEDVGKAGEAGKKAESAKQKNGAAAVEKL